MTEFVKSRLLVITIGGCVFLWLVRKVIDFLARLGVRVICRAIFVNASLLLLVSGWMLLGLASLSAFPATVSRAL